MKLPSDVRYCMDTLAKAGFQAYAVGGCVRDAALGLTPHDYDLCTDATPRQICQVFPGHTLVRSGEKHGTIGVVVHHAVYEITTFRTEGGYTDSRHPDWVAFVPQVKEDLARRDFTCNAMAYAPDTGYADPFGGLQDLQAGVLRAVGDPVLRFTEDPLRILRGVRFAVRFGLTPTEDTMQAMVQLAPTLDRLSRERVFEELCKLLPQVDAAALTKYAPILTQAIPELSPCLGFLQHNPHHTMDVYGHTAQVVENAPAELTLRWAALLHDIGKPLTFTRDEAGVGHFYGHAKESARLANAVLLRLRASNELRNSVVFLVEHHMDPPCTDRKQLKRKLGKHGVQPLLDLLALQKADGAACAGTVSSVFSQVEEEIAALLEENVCLKISDLAISGRDLMDLGIPAGPQLGSILSQLLCLVQEETLPNSPSALLEWANTYWKGNCL